MKIVIDIPDDNYKEIIDKHINMCSYVESLVRQGTVIPKGHGELIDKDVVLDMMNHGILEEYITMMGGVIPADR